ncbi:MAG: iron chelate uptake ABC transporter family permease subunit [Actinomycetota bacterium]
MTTLGLDTPGDGSAPLPLRGVVVRGRNYSMRLDMRAIVVCCLLALGTVLAGLVSLSVGSFDLPVSEVFGHLFGNRTEASEFIVGRLRLPRTLIAAGVGFAFGMSGAIFQALVRNPLGSPDLIGFNSGAALGAVIVIFEFEGSRAEISAGAVAGGLIAALLVYAFAWKRGVQAYRLVLVGIGAKFAVDALVDYELTRADIRDVREAAVWLTGSLNGRGWDEFRTIVLALIVLAPLAVLMQRRLDRLDLGDDTAAALGLQVSRVKLALILVGVGLASLGVAAAGPVAFIAFVAGPVARRLVSSPNACIVPAGFAGAFLMVIADLAARNLLPTEVPVGIMTAAIGGPYLLWLLHRQAQTGAL